MHPAIVAAALALATASLMAGYVAMRRDKSELDWTLLALLLALMVWTTGSLVRFSVETQAGLEASLRVLFLGVFTAPPLWLLVAAHYSHHFRVLERRPVGAALMLPAVLAYLALLSNEAHGWVLREVSFEALRGGGIAWAGPVFWGYIVWAYTCVLVGSLFYLRTAQQMVSGAERRRGLLLAVAAIFPLTSSAIYLFRIVPVSFDLTPSALTVSMALICVAVFRYQLLESLPLARRDVIDHLREGVLIATPAGVILDVNPAAEALLGHSAEELRGRSLASVLAVLADGEEAEDLAALLEGLAPGAPSLLTEVHGADGRIVELSAAWVRGGHGASAGPFAVLRDRTEEKRFERLVRHTQKLQTVGTLASGIAHEVNNPLAYIRANLAEIHRLGERVAEAEEDDKLAAELCDLAPIASETLDGIQRIEQIVGGMRRLASPREEAFRPMDVNEVVSDALRLANLSSDPCVSVETRLASDLPPVEAAPERLVQALLNLLVNARQAFDGAAGRIELETISHGDFVEIWLADDGPGIPEELQERIFDPFFTTKDPDRGTGLGLAIAFDILRDHGGSLELVSIPRTGACFVARLPRA